MYLGVYIHIRKQLGPIPDKDVQGGNLLHKVIEGVQWLGHLRLCQG